MAVNLFFVAILMSYAAKVTLAFNIQDISKGLVTVSKNRGNQFGYSVSLHENEEGKWLMVGAPKEVGKKPDSQSSFDGALYKCLLQEKKLKKANCSILSIEIKQPEELLYSCDFESCDLDQVLPISDDFDWSKTSKSTPSSGTGPTQDHTYENSSTDSGYYMFIEGSPQPGDSNFLVGKSAMMATPVFPGTVGNCLRFWYHMYGEKIVSLNVYLLTNASGLMMIWNKDGQQGNKWLETHVTIITEHSYKVVFEGIKGIDWSADIGVDDIYIYNGQCPEDLLTKGQSVGATLVQNPNTGEMLTCAPTWKYKCNGQVQSSGACYLFDKDLKPERMSVLTPCRTQVCNAAQLDLIFVIDASQSVNKADFANIQMWLRNIISTLPIDSQHIQIGVAVYSNAPVVAFHLNHFYKIENLREAVLNMTFTGGKTQTGKAIDLAASFMFQEENGMRPTAQHVMIVMTDGKSQDSVTEPADRAKAKGITIFAIGVGSANKKELEAISSDPENFIFTTEDYSALNKIRSKLLDSIAALESQGKILTTEQGQAGLSAVFIDGSPVIGAPGLDDWSGGYSTYYSQDNKSEPSVRVLTSFRTLLRKVEKRNASINNINSTIMYPTSKKYGTTLPSMLLTTAATSDVIPSQYSNSQQYSTMATKQMASTMTYNITQSTPIAQSTMPYLSVNITSATSSEYSNQSTFETNRGEESVFSNRARRDVAEAIISNSSILSVSPTKTSHVMYNSSYYNFEVDMSGDVDEATTTINSNVESNETSSPVNPVTTNRVLMKNDQEEMFRDENVFRESQSSIPTQPAENVMDFTTGVSVTSSTVIPEIFLQETHPQNENLTELEEDKPDAAVLQTFSLPLEPDISDIYSNAYFGYAIITGTFLQKGLAELAFGAPRVLSMGSVFIVRNDHGIDQGKPRIMKEFRSAQMGSYYGYSLGATDTNGDGLDDLIVGAPLWFQNQYEDVGRVFVYVSNVDSETNHLQWKEIILSGSNKRGARFGFSIATPGDLNMDGYNDIIVGAPSTGEEGAIYIYSGQPDNAITAEPTQIIWGKERNKNPIYFGFSVDASLDLDNNGYNDIAIGAPGNSRVFILLSKPVIHVDVLFTASPNILNLTHYEKNLNNDTSICGSNGTNICSKLHVCFSVGGVGIPKVVSLSYNLRADVQQKLIKPRGHFVKSNGKVTVAVNETECATFILYLKTPVRYQLQPVVSELTFELTDKRPNSARAAVLDIFDTKPKYTNISFARPCQNSTCYSDLRIMCQVPKASAAQTSDNFTIIIGHVKVIDIIVNLTNVKELAFDVGMDVEFSSSLYLIHVALSSENGTRCMERVIESGGIKNAIKVTSLQDSSGTSVAEFSKFQLIHKNPVMRQEEPCVFKVQFGIHDTFEGGYLSFSFNSKTSSEETYPHDNNCTVRLLTKFQTNLQLRGKSKTDQVEFSSSPVTRNNSLDSIGPEVVHTYQITNKGPSRIPNTSVSVRWPARTVSGHEILYLTDVVCDPPQACVCPLTNLLENLDRSNTTNVSEKNQSREADPVNFGQRNDAASRRMDRNTSKIYTYASLACGTNQGSVCETLHCTVEGLKPSHVVSITLHFRLWKNTFLKGRAWQAAVASKAHISTENSPYIVFVGKGNIFTSEVKTDALNTDFSPIEEEEPIRDTPWWIYVAAISVGLLLLFIAVLLLKKAGFFKSKYKQHLQEELQWNSSYRQNMVEQTQVYEGSRDNPGDATEGLSTFQNS